MLSPKFRLTLSLCLLASLLLSTPYPWFQQVEAQTTTDTAITPMLSFTPDSALMGTAASTEVSVINVNPTSSQTINGGDAFTITFDSFLGTITDRKSVV